MGYLGQVRRELLDPASPLLGAFSQADRGERSLLGHGRVALERLLEPWEPSWPLPAEARTVTGEVALVGVYRRDNAQAVDRLAHDVSKDRVALWALDDESPRLQRHTLGRGPGLRFALLNRLVESLALGPDAWLVIADDDVRFVRGSLAATVGLARAAGLDLCQPSHSRWSYLNWEVTRHHPGSLVRLCRFVEQGPLLVLSPEARRSLIPLPEDMGMGWGVEAVWASRLELRAGIVDAVTVMHERPVGQGGYDKTEQWQQAEALRRDLGWDSWEQMQRVDGTWWAWQPRPPWRRR